MEDIITSFSSLGAVGIVAGVLFKKFLEDSKTDKEYFRTEIKETREIYQEELKALRMDAQKDREVYIDAMDRLSHRLDSVEDTIMDIKNTLVSREG